MSTHVLRKTLDNLELLERMLNRTQLSTKRTTHGNIIDIGETLLSKTHVDVDSLKQAAVDSALEEAEERHKRELRAVVHRLTREKDEERQRELDKQRLAYEDLAFRVAEQRDKAEEEHVRQVTLKLERQCEEALKQQWEECERLKQGAIQEACEVQRRQLRQEFLMEKEKAVAQALAVAREKHKKREEEAVELARQECVQQALAEAAKVAKLHKEEIQRHQVRLAKLYKKYQMEITYKHQIELEYKDLQTDYKRFIDYTDGKYHSDYMMKLRKYGNSLSSPRKCVNIVTVQDIRSMEGSPK